ncbi:MAG: GreA/GreB family elongation factor [Gammaproteobacteria bacterium]|nr:GreA/GreB family elongation factor [Gammaproteobacteria bacterium]
MSRAFVKEDDLRVAATPDRPHSGRPNYVTPTGLAMIRAHLEAASAERQRLLDAGELPDSSPALQAVERDWRYWSARSASAIAVDPQRLPRDRVAFGATVDLEYEQNGTPQRMTVRIVGEDEADAGAGRIGWTAPLARALTGARVGEVVSWARPSGAVEVTVLAIRPLAAQSAS